MFRRRGISFGFLPYSLRISAAEALFYLGLALAIVALTIALWPPPARALPLCARPTAQPCATCHTAFLELTPFGRRFSDPHMVTVRAAWIRENHDTQASQLLGLASNSSDTLESLNASVSYIYNQTWSLTADRIAETGSADALLYGTPTGGPNSAGWITEIAYLPFMHGGPKFWPWLNLRIGLQYTRWDKFDGASTNIDGIGPQRA